MDVKYLPKIPINLPIKQKEEFSHTFKSPSSDRTYNVTFKNTATPDDVSKLERLIVQYAETPSPSPNSVLSPSPELANLMAQLNVTSHSWNTNTTNLLTFKSFFPSIDVNEETIERTTIATYNDLATLIKNKLEKNVSPENYSKLVKNHDNETEIALSEFSLGTCKYLSAIKVFINLSKEQALFSDEQLKVCQRFLHCCEAHFLEQIPVEACSRLTVMQTLNICFKNNAFQSKVDTPNAIQLINFVTLCDKLEKSAIGFYGAISQLFAKDLSEILGALDLPVRELQAYRGQMTVALQQANFTVQAFDTLLSTRQYTDAKIQKIPETDGDGTAFPDAITESDENLLYISAQLNPSEIFKIMQTRTNVALLQVGKTPQKFLNKLATHSEVCPDETYLCGYQKLCVANFTKYNENDIDNPVLLFLYVPEDRITALLDKIPNKYKFGEPVLASPPLESATDEEKTPPTQSST